MTIEQQCEAARARLLIFVNRMAAQQLRRWHEQWSKK
jgi:hypothetical protein